LTTPRALARQQFAESQLKRTLLQSVASADASFRSYWRFQNGDQSWIVMDAPPALEDCAPFIDISGRLLRAGLRAPEVIAFDAQQGFLLLTDFGTRLLLPALNPKSVNALYAMALEEIVQMQRVDTEGLPSYDMARLGAELDLFPEWFLQLHLGVSNAQALAPIWRDTRALLMANALEQPQCFVHRDFHSRNLMLVDAKPSVLRSERLGVIDFQDAVLGPVSYDAVSLLRDCYIEWPEPDVVRWREDFRVRSEQSLQHALPAALFAQQFDLMGVQRHLKVLGIFARLNYRDGKSRYLADLPLVLRYTINVCKRYAPLQPFAEWLIEHSSVPDLTAPRYDAEMSVPS